MPTGRRSGYYPFLTLGSSAMQTYILEWHSPNFHELHFWPFALMLSLTALSWVWSKRPPTFTEWLLYFGTGAAGLVSARNIPLFATIMTPILAHHLTLALRGVEGSCRSYSGGRLSAPFDCFARHGAGYRPAPAPGGD